jgi:hypothetical protein
MLIHALPPGGEADETGWSMVPAVALIRDGADDPKKID